MINKPSEIHKSNLSDLRHLGIAAGLVSMFLFGILYGVTEHPAAVIAGCGGGLLLLIVSLLATRDEPSS